MGDLSPHFDRSEFRCKGHGRAGHTAHYTPVDVELVGRLEILRGERPIIVVSGHRCLWWNRHPSVDGATRSAHLDGMACDIPSGRVSEADARRAGFRGIGLDRYGWAVHLDVRPGTVTTWTYD